MITEKTMKAHRARWFVYAGGRKIPRTSTMRGRWDYDAECSCGWESRTGGALRRAVEEELLAHRLEMQR